MWGIDLFSRGAPGLLRVARFFVFVFIERQRDFYAVSPQSSGDAHARQFRDSRAHRFDFMCGIDCMRPGVRMPGKPSADIGRHTAG